jgi:hypothetical protein
VAVGPSWPCVLSAACLAGSSGWRASRCDNRVGRGVGRECLCIVRLGQGYVPAVCVVVRSGRGYGCAIRCVSCAGRPFKRTGQVAGRAGPGVDRDGRGASCVGCGFDMMGLTADVSGLTRGRVIKRSGVVGYNSGVSATMLCIVLGPESVNLGFSPDLMGLTQGRVVWRGGGVGYVGDWYDHQLRTVFIAMFVDGAGLNGRCARLAGRVADHDVKVAGIDGRGTQRVYGFSVDGLDFVLLLYTWCGAMFVMMALAPDVIDLARGRFVWRGGDGG